MFILVSRDLTFQVESMLNQDPHVSAAVMFGRGYFQAGVVVDPKPGLKFNPSNEFELAEFRNKIWYLRFSLTIHI
jgi:hypothetical protein